MQNLRRAFLLFLAAALLPLAARAQLTIDVIGGAGTTIPIAIVPFEGEAGFPLGITGIVGADLQRSGLFRLVDTGGMPRPSRSEDVRVGDWRARGADAVVVGTMRPLGDGRVEVRFQLVDTAKQSVLASQVYTVTQPQFRATAHRIADAIYETLTGDVGVFSTRIAYITKQGPRYALLVADADGNDPQQIVASNEPLLSPRWSPDGTRIAYVSFEQKKPVVYVQSLATGQRQAVANFRGSNSAPAWSPDGRRLAVTLTRDGGSQLYLMNADGSDVRRITQSAAIDTEAYFTPDGNSLLFTSDRGGSPQIYRADAGQRRGRARHLRRHLQRDAAAAAGRQGHRVRARDGGRFQIAMLDFATRQTQVLTQGPLDESPSVAPNGKLIIYANEQGGRGVLAAVSVDGRVRQRLVSPATDVREPAWGPLAK